MTKTEKRQLAELYRRRNNAPIRKRWLMESTIEQFKDRAIVAEANRIYRQGP